MEPIYGTDPWNWSMKLIYGADPRSRSMELIHGADPRSRLTDVQKQSRKLRSSDLTNFILVGISISIPPYEFAITGLKMFISFRSTVFETIQRTGREKRTNHRKLVFEQLKSRQFDFIPTSFWRSLNWKTRIQKSFDGMMTGKIELCFSFSI